MKTKYDPAKQTLVIFRKYKKGGDILALFPDEPADTAGMHCTCYEHCGQHGSANYKHCMDVLTVPATPAEYADLKAELERVGYSLIIRKRFSRSSR